MRTRTTIVLAALGAVALGLGLTFGGAPREQTHAAAQGELAFPGLTPKLAAARRIELVHGGAKLLLARTGEDKDAAWGIADRANYPAQQGKVHALLTALTELRLDEPRTADPAHYARLGVEDPAAKGAGSTLVRVLDGKGAVIAALIVGHARSTERGSADTLYIRRPTAAQSWLADGKLAVSADRQDWIDRNILDIADAKIAGVTVSRDGAALKFGRKDNKFTLTDPADHPKLDDFKVEEVSRGLANLDLEDVRRAPAPGTPLGEATFITTDGTMVTAKLSKSGPELWATFAATGKDAAPLTAKLTGWAYLIGSWKEAALAPTLATLKAADPPPAPAAPAPSPAPAAQ